MSDLGHFTPVSGGGVACGARVSETHLRGRTWVWSAHPWLGCQGSIRIAGNPAASAVEGRLNDRRFRQMKTIRLYAMLQMLALQAVILTRKKAADAALSA